MRRLTRISLAALILLGLAALSLRLTAPQVITLAGEGFPAPVWPAAGEFAQVKGVSAPTDPAADPAPGPPPPQAALQRFEASEGRALLVWHGGKLTAETYGPGLSRDDRLNSYSLVKGLVGALVLRAVADGRIAGLEARLPQILGPDAPDVTIQELLTMTSGLALQGSPEKPVDEKSMDDAGFSPFSGLARLHAFGTGSIMAQLRVDPQLRGQFHYQSVNTALLGLAVERAYGRPLPQILSDLIWRPAGAADAEWRMFPAGEGVSAYCCLYARPIDWLLVGRFLMQNGRPDAPFLPPRLWQDFMAPQLDATARQQGVYGLQIRHDVLDRAGEAGQGPFAYFLGHGGQMVYFLPDQDMVVIRFGAKPQLLHSTLYELMDDKPRP